MLKNLNTDHIYIVCGHTDMRKSIDGLAAIIQQQYQLDLFCELDVNAKKGADILALHRSDQ